MNDYIYVKNNGTHVEAVLVVGMGRSFGVASLLEGTLVGRS